MSEPRADAAQILLALKVSKLYFRTIIPTLH